MTKQPPTRMAIQATSEATGKTQQQVADEVGIGLWQYQKYELYENEPRISIAIKISKALNTTVEESVDDFKNLLIP